MVSFQLYALAARNVLENNEKNASVITNGQLIWNKMRRLSFEGLIIKNLKPKTFEYAEFVFRQKSKFNQMDKFSIFKPLRLFWIFQN